MGGIWYGEIHPSLPCRSAPVGPSCASQVPPALHFLDQPVEPNSCSRLLLHRRSRLAASAS